MSFIKTFIAIFIYTMIVLYTYIGVHSLNNKSNSTIISKPINNQTIFYDSNGDIIPTPIVTLMIKNYYVQLTQLQLDSIDKYTFKNNYENRYRIINYIKR